jgi:Fe2+ or Zn2+ uptake regulation protein
VTPWKLMTQERIERRRRNGCMSPDIRREFTRSQAAVMRVVLDQIIRHPEARCTLLHSHIAILSAMSTTTVHNTLRKAKALGLVQATNSTRASHITVVSPELRAWMQNAFEEQEGRAKGR